MKTAEIINHNLTTPEESKAQVGDNQIQINVIDKGKVIERLFVNTVEEAAAYEAQLNTEHAGE